MSVPEGVPEVMRCIAVQYCNCSMKLPQPSANSLPSLVNRLGLNIRSQSYPNDLAFSSVRIDLLAKVEKRGPLVRDGDFSAKCSAFHSR